MAHGREESAFGLVGGVGTLLGLLQLCLFFPYGEMHGLETVGKAADFVRLLAGKHPVPLHESIDALGLFAVVALPLPLPDPGDQLGKTGQYFNAPQHGYTQQNRQGDKQDHKTPHTAPKLLFDLFFDITVKSRRGEPNADYADLHLLPGPGIDAYILDEKPAGLLSARLIGGYGLAEMAYGDGYDVRGPFADIGQNRLQDRIVLHQQIFQAEHRNNVGYGPAPVLEHLLHMGFLSLDLMPFGPGDQHGDHGEDRGDDFGRQIHRASLKNRERRIASRRGS